MRSSAAAIFAVMSLLACHSRQPEIVAWSEGLRIGEGPLSIRPARALDAGLAATNRGGLVIHADAGPEPTAATVTLEPVDRDKHTVREITTANGIGAFDALLPGEYVVTARRIGLRPQRVRVMIAPGFTDTLCFTLGQP